MTLADVLQGVADRRKTLVVYASDEAPDVAGQFATRNVTVERESLPAGGSDGFVVFREAGEFVAAFGLADLSTLLDPPLYRPWDLSAVSRPWRALYEVLDETTFASFDRRQMLATAREIEERAWRVGAGTLHVGFQNADALADQRDVYRQLAAETDLSIRIYVDESWDGRSVPGVTVDAEAAPEIGRFWFLVYDAEGDPTNACALLAEERSPGEYFGSWTYDPERVEKLDEYLRRTYW